MQFFILVLLLCFFIFLFCLYYVSRDDFLLIRRDISEDSVFNLAFLLAGASLFSSRLLWAIFHPSSNFFNPLYFFLFPYFPGLSLLGGVIGGGIFLYAIFKAKKMPVGRLLDLFAISALAGMPVGVTGYFIMSGHNFLSWNVIITIVSYISLFLFFFFFLFPRFTKGRIEEGSMATLFLFAFSAVSLLGRVATGKFTTSPENIILVLLFVFVSAFYIKKTKLISKYLSSRKK
ncbi:MAG: prolipoprotein diacylglyceryl transferase family protein [Candidatus Levyibacteriota bacterium]